MLFLFRYHNKAEKELAKYIHNMFGFYPRNISLFQLAFTHKSMHSIDKNGVTISNERLEYLGDAVLSAIVAEFLFKKYPTKQEGFLTEMRSRIVSRASLNKISEKFGLQQVISYVRPNDPNINFRSIGGNAFEAFTGALFLDRGYKFTYHIITEHVIKIHINLEELINNNNNFKSRLLEWGQKGKHHVEFVIDDVSGKGYNKTYNIKVMIDDKEYCTASNRSIKSAEQLAAEKTLKMIETPAE